MQTKSLLVIASGTDLLAQQLVAAAGRKGVPVLHCQPQRLASVPLTIRGDECQVADQPVGAVLFRSHPTATFSCDYARTDQPFVDSELSAIWLAVLNLPSVWAVNRYDAEMWYDGSRWPVWQRRMHEAGIPVVSSVVGGHASGRPGHYWMPYGGAGTSDVIDVRTHALLGSSFVRSTTAARSLIVCGKAIGGSRLPAVAVTASYLENIEINLAEASFDQDGSVLQINTFPAVNDPEIAAAASQRLLEQMHDHLCHW